jgi:protein-S-isoprenylcysteine O-methyltransferase Ste14
VCSAERLRSAQIGCWLFRHRGVLPVPLLAAALFLPARMSIASWSIGLAILVVAEVLRLAGVAAAGAGTRRRSRAVAHLITDGPFAWMRNPLYFGNGLAWIGVAAITGIPWLVPAGVAAFAIEYGLIVRYEEGVLESLFGEAYLVYKRRTPRWIPKRPQPGPRPLGRGYDWREAWRSESSTFANLALVLLALVAKLVASGA